MTHKLRQNNEFQNTSHQKNTNFQLPMAKKVQNLTIFGEIIVYLRNQIAKNKLK